MDWIFLLPCFSEKKVCVLWFSPDRGKIPIPCISGRKNKSNKPRKISWEKTEMKYVILAPALTELEEAVSWYNLQYSGLGEAFKKAVQETLHRIVLHPYLASEIESGYYRKDFSYGHNYPLPR
jgi:hypothetical protein